MPVYNAAPYLPSAVASVLAQTFADFELLAIDDGSTDGSREVLRGIEDHRLRVVERPHGGVVSAMQTALELARADLIARADADDLCALDRLARQVAFLDAHPEVVVLGGAMRVGARTLTYPPDPLRIRWTALYRSPFANTTLMFRRQAALAVGGYPGDHYFVDDYPFVSRLIAHGEGANLDGVLVTVRPQPGGISQRHPAAQAAEGDRVRRGNIAALVAAGDLEPLVHLLTGGPVPRAAPVEALLERLLAGFRRRWAVTDAGWRAVAPWIGREIFERALAHGVRAPRILVRMAACACRLDRRLVLRPAFAKGLLRHLVLARFGW